MSETVPNEAKKTITDEELRDLHAKLWREYRDSQGMNAAKISDTDEAIDPFYRELEKAFLRGIEWQEENDDMPQFRAKAARDYADKAITYIGSIQPLKGE